MLSVVDADDRLITRAERSTITIDAPLAQVPQKLSFPNGVVFESTDHAGLAALTGTGFWHRLRAAEAFGPRLVFVVLAAIAAVWVIWRYGLDLIVAAAIAVTPPAVVDQIDRGTLQTVDLIMAEPSALTPDDTAHAQVIFAQVLAALPDDQRQAHDFTLLFRDMPGMGPNALALPGGTIVLTDALIQSFPDHPDVIATILGHEVGHVVDAHGLQRVYRALGIFALVALMAGETGPFLEEALLEGNLILSLSYSRAQERAADAFGIRLAEAAGFDPRGLQVFFETLGHSHDDGGSDWLSTHPAPAERIQAVEDYLAGN